MGRRARLARLGALVLAGALLGACGAEPDPCACAEVDGGPDDAAGSTNPTGEFANTLIRGRPPGSAFAGNTAAAIAEAAEAGYEYVEVDVRPTADGRLLPCRRDDLATFSTCRGRVSSSTAAELAECMTTNDAPAPLAPLDVALAGASFRGVYLDLKSTETEPLSSIDDLVGALLSLQGALDDPTVLVAMSYRRDVAEALLAAGVRAALKGYPEDPQQTLALLDEAAAASAEMICVNIDVIDDEVASQAEADGVWLLPWARADQVTARSVCSLRGWRAGGLINEVHERVERLLGEPCR